MASIDSISNLPDSLLLHIMSFLDSQKAVQSCVLSKRWKNLWASLQRLHLDQSKFKTTSELKGERFTYFVNTLLLLRDTSDLQKFHLRCSYNDDSIMSWILYAIKCNAKVIKIKIDVMDYKRLPPFMFNSASLEELNLCIYNIDKGIGFRAINLPRLKKLKLRVRSNDSNILNKLALGCPALEDLYLSDCIMNIRVVSFPKLKYLKIRSWKEDMFVEFIRAPNLVSLVLVGLAQPYGEISFEKMPSLMNATISLWSRSCYSFDAKKCNLLRAVANVQKLDLSGKTIQALFQIELPTCPTFFNLTTMLLRHFCMICHSNEVGDIL
ncbi:F-box/LRR-repeat protein At4g14096-like [Carex rostrata]